MESTVKELVACVKLTRPQLKAAFASLTIGAGAAGLVLAHESVSCTGHHLLGGAVRTATQYHDLCQGDGASSFGGTGGMLMNTQAEALLDSGCALAAETWSATREELGWSNGDVSRCFTHQVGSTHRDRLYEALELDPALDYSTFEFLGNVGFAASLPITAAMGLERQPPASGEQIALLGIGSGFELRNAGRALFVGSAVRTILLPRHLETRLDYGHLRLRQPVPLRCSLPGARRRPPASP